jgi:hypothetical protein
MYISLIIRYGLENGRRLSAGIDDPGVVLLVQFDAAHAIANQQNFDTRRPIVEMYGLSCSKCDDYDVT